MVGSNKLKNVELNTNNSSRDKIISWFFAYPASEVSLTKLTKEVKISKTHASRVVSELVGEGFLELEILGKIWRIKANFKHKYFRLQRIAYNLSQIGESNILEIVDNEIANYSNIVLFGSYRKGDDTEWSDIDIAVEVKNNKPLKIIELGKIKKLGYRKNVAVNLHVFDRNKIDINLFSNIANGIVLDGFLEASL
jgi:predicted nucleotidyltransferase